MGTTKILTDDHERSLVAKLPFEPTESQSRALYTLARFLASHRDRCALLIKGYAGTGKTSLMWSLVHHLKSIGKEVVLLAPTGRAAKVLALYTGRQSYTIHRYIYRRSTDSNGVSRFSLSPNKRKDVVFIVDEASMIGNDKGVLYNGLLEDLIEHIYSGVNCRLVLLGDDAQLPPVGLLTSPALDIDFMANEFDLTIAECVLTEVIRQSRDSSILSLASSLRKKVFHQGKGDITLHYKIGPEVMHISSQELAEELESSYDDHGKESVRVICRSNRTANRYNQQIRSQIFQLDERLSAGELLMVVRNNYLWTSDKGHMPFLANGELCELMYIKNQRSLYDLDFAVLGLSFPDYSNEPSIECKAIMNTLDAETPSLSESRMKQLYQDVKTDLSSENGPSEIRSKIQQDPWFNALQIKYGYAITCHKAQGGQWPVVFVDRGFLSEDKMDKDYWRWLYTAVTRASERLYLINF